MQHREWIAWLALKMVRGVGNAVGIDLVRAFGGPAAALRADPRALARAGVRRDVVRSICGFDRWQGAEAQVERLGRSGGRLVTWHDRSYPQLLRHIHDPPLFLFVLGDLMPDDALAVAVVGTRHPSPYGCQMTRALSEGLAAHGLAIVSGLARGIDAEAHRAALRAGGRTIAVLGSGIDVVYPSEHHQLQMCIAKNGAVVSEYFMGSRPDAENFPNRNRIISGLSLGSVVVEANERSGSLITAECALDQGREVFAVPGPIGARSRGPHRLIRQGATLVESAADIAKEIAPQLCARRADRKPAPVSDVEERVLGCVDEAPLHVDEVVRRSGLPVASVLENLLTLELRGLVHQLPGKLFARNACVVEGSER